MRCASRCADTASGVRSALAIAFGAVLASACAREEPASPPALPPPAPPPTDWARHVRPAPAAGLRRAIPWEVREAAMDDRVEAARERVNVRRLVYRVTFAVPPEFRDRRAGIATPAAELQLDLSGDRLRARFVGPGWPFERGVEVRLRSDLPGVYLFDGDGGRSLGAGELATWFEGKRLGDSRATPRVRREPGAANEGPSEPLCALLAEWTARERNDLLARCAGGSIPPTFAFGPWRAELTAMVPMELPGAALRADEVDPPVPVVVAESGQTLAPEDAARLVPTPDALDSERGALDVDNAGDTRAIVFVDGVPIGWVGAGASARFDGLRVGTHRVGALRPLGVVRASPRPLRVPGRLAIGRSSSAAGVARTERWAEGSR